MTVSTQVNGAHPDADLVEVAEAMGVFVRNDAGEIIAIDDLTGLARELTKRQFVPLDDLMHEKTGANDVVESSTVERTTIRQRIGRAIRVVKTWARQAVKTARDALAFLAAPLVELARKSRLNRQGVFYRPRHGVRRAWYGVQRSSASSVAIRRTNAARQPADSEPALPEHFVGYISLVIETMRGHEDALHPRAGYQFRC